MPTASLRQEEWFLHQPNQLTAEAHEEVIVDDWRSARPTVARHRINAQRWHLVTDEAEGWWTLEHATAMGVYMMQIISSISSLVDETDFANWDRLWWPRSRQLSQPMGEELLDWDATVRISPNRPARTIVANVEYRGQARPKLAIDPEDW